jgi:hypothetical protein
LRRLAVAHHAVLPLGPLCAPLAFGLLILGSAPHLHQFNLRPVEFDLQLVHQLLHLVLHRDEVFDLLDDSVFEVGAEVLVLQHARAEVLGHIHKLL